MSSFPCLVRRVSGLGEVRYSLGDRLVDRYLEFVAGRARPNTLRAVAFDLKAFLTVLAGKDPVAVTAADEFEFLAYQRGDRSVVRLADRFYMEHENKLEDVDFRPLLRIWEEPVHLLVPIVIVDELDGLKKSRKDRWRPGYTLAVLDRVLASSTGPARLTAEDFSALASGGIPHGEVTIELVFDPPGHVRLPINDDEIIDRILAIQPLAGRQVMLLTYDTGQSTRAQAAGLRVIKLAQPAESEPAATARPAGKGGV